MPASGLPQRALGFQPERTGLKRSGSNSCRAVSATGKARLGFLVVPVQGIRLGLLPSRPHAPGCLPAEACGLEAQLTAGHSGLRCRCTGTGSRASPEAGEGGDPGRPGGRTS